MRKVEAYYYKDGTVHPVVGLFHQWAPMMIEGREDSVTDHLDQYANAVQMHEALKELLK